MREVSIRLDKLGEAKVEYYRESDEEGSRTFRCVTMTVDEFRLRELSYTIEQALRDMQRG